jgi:hypothetical protein
MTILKQREKKGNAGLASPSAAIIADQALSGLILFHEVLTKKGQAGVEDQAGFLFLSGRSLRATEDSAE